VPSTLAVWTIRLGVLLVIYAVVAAGACLFGCSLMFQPPRASYRQLEGGFHLKTADGHRIYVVHRVNPRARHTILFSHGNAEDLGYLDPYLREYEARGYSVLAWDYRGYGRSTGEPSESAVLEDLKVLYEYLTVTRGVDPRTIVAHGRSLGGGSAVELARRHELGGVILESTFVSAFRVVTRIPLLPCDRFRNLAKLASVREPVLVIHGKKDGVVAFWHGQKLYAAARGPRHRLWVPRAGHNDLLHVAGEDYWRAIRAFTDGL
jgi:abhydrolase domain-containing protein 17